MIPRFYHTTINPFSCYPEWNQLGMQFGKCREPRRAFPKALQVVECFGRNEYSHCYRQLRRMAIERIPQTLYLLRLELSKRNEF